MRWNGSPTIALRRFVTPVAMSIGLAAATGCPQPDVECATHNENASPDVDGTYTYGGQISGNNPGSLSGTITFERDGDMVAVTDTTYNFGSNRKLSGTAMINGNRLEILLNPSNGDTDYQADVTFVFSEDGSSFCVEFSDTNGDFGDLGSFTGVKQ